MSVSPEYQELNSRLMDYLKVMGVDEEILGKVSVRVLEFYKNHKQEINLALLDYSSHGWKPDVLYKA